MDTSQSLSAVGVVNDPKSSRLLPATISSIATTSIHDAANESPSKSTMYRKRQKLKQKQMTRSSQNSTQVGRPVSSLEAWAYAFALMWLLVVCTQTILKDHQSTHHEISQKSRTSFQTAKTTRMPLKHYLEGLSEPYNPNNQITISAAEAGYRMLSNPEEDSHERQRQDTLLFMTDEDEPQPPALSQSQVQNQPQHTRDPYRKVLTAYLESPAFLRDNIKPLPRRNTRASQLQVQEFPAVQNCSTLLQDFGRSVVDHFPSQDPFLPWIHDFFPSTVKNGTTMVMQFVAQNRRNCQTGEGMEAVMHFLKPQIALFQPVPVIVVQEKKEENNGQIIDAEPTIRLADSIKHATAKETRFICRFHNASNHAFYTLSDFPFNYEFVSWRKHQAMMEEESSKAAINQSPFWVSQLLFSCPIPQQFQSLVRNQGHVIDDQAMLWVDVVPIRTPPRYNNKEVLLTEDHIGKELVQQHAGKLFDLAAAYGTNHTLPSVLDSGRWANLPICRSPLAQAVAEDEKGLQSKTLNTKLPIPLKQKENAPADIQTKVHRLVACTWTSASYQRRGNAFTVRDSRARLREWILFHQLVGFEHLYVYDNSPMPPEDNGDGDPSDYPNLQAVAREFPPESVTYIRWPCTICSNNRPMHKNPGDRSSQYAAEASCRERFGPSTEWMSFIDTDEYLVPMKKDTWKDVLDDMEQKNLSVLKMRSSRGLPRHDLMVSLANQHNCDIPPKRSVALRKLQMESCQEPSKSETFLKVYNCDYIKPPRPDRFARAMKQLFRPDYVKSHYVHYSTVTQDIARLHKDQPNTNASDPLWDWKVAGDDKEIFLDEIEQGTLIHARSVLPHETIYRSAMCQSESKHKCSLGFVCPDSTEWLDEKVVTGLGINPFKDDKGKYCNCWINSHIENSLVPRLEQTVREHSEKLKLRVITPAKAVA